MSAGLQSRDCQGAGSDIPMSDLGTMERPCALAMELQWDPICDRIPLPHGHGSVTWRLFPDLGVDILPAGSKLERKQLGVSDLEA